MLCFVEMVKLSLSNFLKIRDKKLVELIVILCINRFHIYFHDITRIIFSVIPGYWYLIFLKQLADKWLLLCMASPSVSLHEVFLTLSHKHCCFSCIQNYISTKI